MTRDVNATTEGNGMAESKSYSKRKKKGVVWDDKRSDSQEPYN